LCQKIPNLLENPFLNADGSPYAVKAACTVKVYRNPSRIGRNVTVDGSESSAWAVPSIVSADGVQKSLLTITVISDLDNGVKGLTREDFVVTGLKNAALSNFQDLGNGNYSFDITNQSAELITLIIEVKGFELIDQPEILFLEGSGTSLEPYQIGNWFELDLIRHVNRLETTSVLNNQNIYFKLVNDLDQNSAGYTQLVGSPNGWDPIGFYNDPFTGNFDGDNNEIKDLVIDRPNSDYVGLFSYNTGTISNLKLKNVDIRGNYYVGSLVGVNDLLGADPVMTSMISKIDREIIKFNKQVNSNDGPNIKDCVVDGTIQGSSGVGGITGINLGIIEEIETLVIVNGYQYIGGISGDNSGQIINGFATVLMIKPGPGMSSYLGGISGGNFEGDLINSQADVLIEDDTAGYVGGVSGDNYRGYIEGCSAFGEIEGHHLVGGLTGFNYGTVNTSYTIINVEGSDEVGGFAGSNEDDLSYINQCYAASSTTGFDYVGGLVGTNGGVIINSYAVGSVHAANTVGGLVGSVNDTTSSQITNTYAAVVIVGSPLFPGGLIGSDNAGSVEYSYWDTDVSGCSTSAGGEGKTTIEMKDKSTFDSEWDFNNIWLIDEGISYPYLISNTQLPHPGL